jgi:hypothetical protein
MEGNGNRHNEEEENMIGSRISLRKLADRTLLSNNGLAAEARLYNQTVRRALAGEPIQRVSAAKLVAALNRLLGTDYEIEDIDGLHLAGETTE